MTIGGVVTDWTAPSGKRGWASTMLVALVLAQAQVCTAAEDRPGAPPLLSVWRIADDGDYRLAFDMIDDRDESMPRDGRLNETILTAWMFAEYGNNHRPAGDETLSDFDRYARVFGEARRGSPSAQTALANLYAFGIFVGQDVREAARWYGRAADQGYAPAQYALGVLYGRGIGVPEDYDEAAQWHHRAARQGLPFAIDQMCVYYVQGGLGPMADGQEFIQDIKASAHWCRKSAEWGYRYAQSWLFVIYSSKRFPPDTSEATRWQQRAANQGDELAQAQLGSKYLTGEGVPVDKVQAFKWLNLAVASGDPVLFKEERDKLAFLASRMTPEDRAEGHRLIRNFQRIKERSDLLRALFWGRGLPPALRPGRTDDLAPSTGDDLVRSVQQHLKKLGFDPGPIDGISGNQTRSAIRAFQSATGATPDGAVSEMLLDQLKQQLASGSEPDRTAKSPQIVSSGSGFVVNQNDVMTNRHVVADCVAVRVRGRGKESDGQVFAFNAKDDLAVVRTVEQWPDTAVFRASAQARLAERVMVAGFPLSSVLANDLTVATGEVSALAGLGGDARLMQISAPVQQGNSGGPLLDADGSVIGVVTSKLDAMQIAALTGDLPQNVNFAVTGSTAIAFLDANGIGYQTRAEALGLDSSGVAEAARRFTVAVECYR